jgi:hypothetical protein
VHICYPSTWESEAKEFQVQGQLGLQRETLFQKIKRPSFKMKRILVDISPKLIKMTSMHMK